ncbi:MAG TPA: hypothetical protein VGP25_01370 [Gemmatimonadaceae bacterium]|nr:hypothetical protein [Gemmatimonadaceae bacterium]
MSTTPSSRPTDTVFEPPMAGASRDSAATAGGSDWVGYAIVLAVYALLLILTRTVDQGDSNVYADDLVRWLRGRPTAARWDFGHVIWRPLHFMLFRTIHGAKDPATDGVLFSHAITMMTSIVVAVGALSVATFRSWLRRLDVSPVAATTTTIAFATAAAFLGYTQTASSYVPALTMILIALRELAADERQSDTRTILVASFAFALAVLLWFPMVLAVPAAAISMILLRGSDARRWKIAIAVSLLSGTITVVSYAPIAYLAGVRSVATFQKWMADATHDIQGIGGVSRAIIGFGRSLVNMDRLGLIAKRHLIGDPYNPASWADVARAGLLRLAVLYAVLGAIVIWLARRASGRRALAFVIATAIPVVGFALKWQGGDLERYLALFPALFLAIALAITLLPSRAQLAAGIAVVLALAVVNVPAIARSKSVAQCAQLTARLASVPRNDGKLAVLWTPHELDEIASYRGRCPHSPLLTSPMPIRAFGLVMANNARATQWPDSLASRSAQLWRAGGHLWVSRRAFVDTPLVTWKWAEGDDPRLHWKDFPTYFRQLDVGPPVGGEDGFVEVLPTPKTLEAMQRMRTKPAGLGG